MFQVIETGRCELHKVPLRTVNGCEPRMSYGVDGKVIWSQIIGPSPRVCPICEGGRQLLAQYGEAT